MVPPEYSKHSIYHSTQPTLQDTTAMQCRAMLCFAVLRCKPCRVSHTLQRHMMQHSTGQTHDNPVRATLTVHSTHLIAPQHDLPYVQFASQDSRRSGPKPRIILALPIKTGCEGHPTHGQNIAQEISLIRIGCIIAMYIVQEIIASWTTYCPWRDAVLLSCEASCSAVDGSLQGEMTNIEALTSKPK